jgi:hypothetical protein
MTIQDAHWSTNSVEVCFASKRQTKESRFGKESKTFPPDPKVHVENSTPEEREIIETVVRNEYRLDSTGFEFTGFGECVPGTKAKIFVYLGRGGPLGAANIGENMKVDHYWMYHDRKGNVIFSPVYVKAEIGKPSYVYLQNLKQLSAIRSPLGAENLLRIHALHEFGHAAGLLHEDERDEANGGANCAYQNGQSNYRTSAPIPLTKYDPASVMSYCFIDALTNRTGLHYQVAPVGVDPASLPKSGLPIVRWPGLYFEDSLRLVSSEKLPDRLEFEIRPGLSEKDRESIRCMYSPIDASTDACHALE